MSKITGVVQAVSEKSGGSGAKKWLMRSFCIDDKWYGGFISKDDKAAADLQLSIYTGDTVEFTPEESGKFTNWTDDIVIIKKGATATSASGVEINLKDYQKTLGGTLKVAAAMADTLVRYEHVTFAGDPEAVKLQYVEFVYGIAKELADRSMEETPGDGE